VRKSDREREREERVTSTCAPGTSHFSQTRSRLSVEKKFWIKDSSGRESVEEEEVDEEEVCR
jgi:hypothetical protein